MLYLNICRNIFLALSRLYIPNCFTRKNNFSIWWERFKKSFLEDLIELTYIGNVTWEKEEIYYLERGHYSPADFEFSRFFKNTRKYKKRRKTAKRGEKSRWRTVLERVSAQSNGDFPIKLQIKSHILFECQWDHGGYHESWSGKERNGVEKKRVRSYAGRIAPGQEVSSPFPGGKIFF